MEHARGMNEQNRSSGSTPEEVEVNTTSRPSSEDHKLNYGSTSKNENAERINLPGAVSSENHKPGISKSEHSIDSTNVDAEFMKSLKLTVITLRKNEDSSSRNDTSEALGEQRLNQTINVVTINEQTKIKSVCPSFYSANKVNLISKSENASDNVVKPTDVVQSLTTDIPLNNNQTSRSLEDKNVKSVNVSFPTRNSKEKSTTTTTLASLSDRSEFNLVIHESLSSVGSNVCRICMTAGRERLISPCNCKGSLASVHLSCLERWLNQVGRTHCELCGYSYPAISTPRYTIVEALRLWFGNPRNRTHLQSDCLIFWLLSTVTAGLLAVCIVGTQYFILEGNKMGISHRITETAMDFFMAIVLCGYSITVYLLWKDHYILWNRWRKASVNVRLLLSVEPRNNAMLLNPRGVV